MNQQNFALGVKYNFKTNARIRPVVGAVASYTLRDYKKTCGFYCGYGNQYSPKDSTSIDVGLVLGVDMDIADNFSVGVDYRYMKNMSNDADNNNNNGFGYNGYGGYGGYGSYNNFEEPKTLEDTTYTTISLLGRYRF